MSASCPLCDGACAGANLGPLLDPTLGWLWEQIGRTADRRGDAALASGKLSVRAPDAAEQRAAATGLLGGRALKDGQTRTIDLGQLVQKLRVRGTALTPGAVAAHALGRRLAVRAAQAAQRLHREHELRAVFVDLARAVPPEAFGDVDADEIWAALRRSGWLGRLVSAGAEHPLRAAAAVIAALPTGAARCDRRRLAADATGDPHALDHGAPLAGLVLGLLAAAGRVGSRQRPREAWASVGVDCDDVVGGLIAVGLLPAGWVLPPGALVTLPPRVLGTCEWPPPDAPGSFVFVTENPSVASAAADLATAGPGHGHAVRLLCTSGTPAAHEIAAIGRLAHAGWRVAVRADFDVAGICHVAAILKAVPDAVPWRMAAEDYLESLRHEPQQPQLGPSERIPDAPWAPELTATMRARRLAAYEESLLPLLLDDLRCGRPGHDPLSPQ
jgi:uncharacterized protein (TIGR02679 family)